MDQEIRFCDASDGVQIAYAVLGDGPPFLWIPGWVSHLEVEWANPGTQALLLSYAERFRLIRYDKRGTGLSDRNVDDFSVEARVRDVEAVLDTLGLERVILRGASEGGPVAMTYAAIHPERVSRLILLGTLARGSDIRPEIAQAMVALIRAEWNLGSQTMANLLAPGASPEQTDWIMRLQREGASPEAAVRMIETLTSVDVSQQLGKIRAPTLVIHGRHDKAIPFETGRRLAASIPGARLVPFDGGHQPASPEVVMKIREVVFSFLAEELKSWKAPSRRSSTSGSVTIMFTDLVGSTELTQTLGDDRAQELLRAHNEMVRAALRKHGGTEIKHTGDGFMATFESASQAVTCALLIQKSFDDRNQSNPGEPLQVRIGLNSGEPVREDGDLFGTSVQLAARICSTARPGQILGSSVVRELSAGKDFEFVSRGVTQLKGFAEPVDLFEIAERDTPDPSD